LTNKTSFTRFSFLLCQPKLVGHRSSGAELAGRGGSTWLGQSFFLKLDNEVTDSLLLLGSDSLNRTVKIVWHLAVDWLPAYSARLKVAESFAAALVFAACLAF
jgi:hypothetical protein